MLDGAWPLRDYPDGSLQGAWPPPTYMASAGAQLITKGSAPYIRVLARRNVKASAAFGNTGLPCFR